MQGRNYQLLGLRGSLHHQFLPSQPNSLRMKDVIRNNHTTTMNRYTGTHKGSISNFKPQLPPLKLLIVAFDAYEYIQKPKVPRNI